MEKESHNYDHRHNHNNIPTKNILWILIVNTFFTIAEFFFAILTNSVALYSNAIHDLGDSFILLFSFSFEKKSKKGRSNKYTYGYRRFSLLGSLINIIILIIGACFILNNVLHTFKEHQVVNIKYLLILAIIGLLINGYGAYKLAKESSITNKTLFINLLADVFSWLTILISSLFILIFNVQEIDIILSICIAIWLLYMGLTEGKNLFNIFMLSVPDDVDINSIQKLILNMDTTIFDVHDIHIWCLDGSDYIATMHIEVSNKLSHKEIMELKIKIKETLEKEKINHTTIEIDIKGEKCLI